MDKSTLSSFLGTYKAAYGPQIYSREIDFGALGGKQTFHFRRLAYLETQLLRDTARIEMGADPTKPENEAAAKKVLLLAPVRQLAATLVDEKGEPIATYDEILAWPSDLIDKLFVASVTVNTQSNESREDIGKKSGATQVAESSSS